MNVDHKYLFHNTLNMHIETPIYNHMLRILFVYVAFYQTFGWSVYNETPLLITTNIAMSQCQMYAILIKILNFSHIYKKIISQFNIHCTLYSFIILKFIALEFHDILQLNTNKNLNTLSRIHFKVLDFFISWTKVIQDRKKIFRH